MSRSSGPLSPEHEEMLPWQEVVFGVEAVTRLLHLRDDLVGFEPELGRRPFR